MSAGKEWIYQTNIYEVNIRQYTREGTINAFASHLPRLKDMGIQTLWFMPLTPISEKERKGRLGSYYACSDYKSINPEFGTSEDFKALVKKSHEMGFKVIIDWVANHTGWDHIWTKLHPEWYKRDDHGHIKKASGMDDIIELDFSSREMRKAMIEAMLFWIRDYDIDGFRCDLAFWVQLDFWQEAILQLNQNKALFWLAEMEPSEFPAYMEVFDAAYSWNWMHKSEEWYKKTLPLKTLVQVLSDYETVPGVKAWFTSNHDENSWNGTEYEKYGAAALCLAIHSLTWPGIPLIYSGQELPNKKRLLFFDKDSIEWTTNLELHGFYKTLLELQISHPALDAKTDHYLIHTSADTNILSYLRKKNEEEVLVILNLSAHHTRFDILSSWVNGKFREIFTSDEMEMASAGFSMMPWEYRVYVKIPG